MHILKIYFFIFIQLCSLGLHSQNKAFISPHDPLIVYTGRTDDRNLKEVRFSYPGTSFKIKFEGSVCHILLNNKSHSDTEVPEPNFYLVIVDDRPPVKFQVTDFDHVYKLKLEKGIHLVEVIKLTESSVGTGILRGFEIENSKKLLPAERSKRRIEFIGNSITCGYGNEGTTPECHFSAATENYYMAYGAVTARNLMADHVSVACSGIGVIQNYDKGQVTMPVIYSQVFPHQKEPQWDFKKWQPDIVVINLGTNDFAHEKPDSAIFVKTYLYFLKRIRSNYPHAHLYCIEGSMIRDGWPVGIPSFTLLKSFIEAAVKKFRNENDKKIDTFYHSTAQEGDFGCDYHPNLQKHKVMADELTTFIKSKSGW